MTHLNPYDVRVAFDDLYEAEATYAPRIDIACILGEIVRVSRANRIASPSVRFEVLGDGFSFGMYQPPDPHKFALIGNTPFTIDAYVPPDPKHYSIIGGEDALLARGLHRFTDYYKKFKAALPGSKIAVLDSRISKLDSRLSALEEAFSVHTADHHGTYIHGDEPERIPLRRDALCWQRGKNVFCTVQGDRGGYLTSCTSIVPAATEVVGIACMLGLDGNDIAENANYLYAAAQALTCDKLANELHATKSQVPRGSKVVGAIRSASDPAVCAAMSLIQRCQKGDRGACAELSRLADVCGVLVEDAARRLYDGQKRKGRRH